MRAAVYRSYGPPEVIKIEDIPRPSLHEEDRVLVRVHCASVNPGDYLIRRGYLPARIVIGLLRPKEHHLGMDFAGTVEAVGKNVTRCKVGERVFGGGRATNAEYICPRQTSISLMPDNVTFQEAAAIPVVAITALQALRDVAQIKAGHKVLIYGASGGIGHAAVQLARVFGAEVTAVCSTSNLPWVKQLGAHHMIDYTKENFAGNGRKYDIILDAVGKRTFFSCLRSLTDTGVYISEHFLYPKYHPVQFALSSLIGRKKAKMHLAKFTAADMDFLSGLMAEGKLRAVIDKCYPFEQIADAHRHVESWRTKGKVVLEITRG